MAVREYFIEKEYGLLEIEYCDNCHWAKSHCKCKGLVVAARVARPKQVEALAANKK